MTTTLLDALAACDQHLPNLLRRAVPAQAGRAARIVHLGEPDQRYTCECGVPAHWYVRVFHPEPEPAQ